MDAIIYLAPAVFLLGGVVKGGIGIGLPTTVIAILSQFVDPRFAIALSIVPIIVANLWQVHREGRWRASLARFWPFSLTLAVVLFASGRLAALASGDTVMLVTGAGIVLFAGTSLIKHPPALSPRWERPAQVVAGALSGVLGGLTGLWAPPMMILLLSLRLEKSEMVASLGMLLFLGGLPLLGSYAAHGLVTMEIFLWSLVMVVPVFIGFSVGEVVRGKLDAQRFQKALLLFFLLIGLNMIRRALIA